ncbi:MAG TPA: hypothetical protein VJM33_10400 [Microthrixaceae bacterium]|nr:hypothetical protein [Microthrixaceae bacterium]
MASQRSLTSADGSNLVETREVLFVCHANICRSPMAERIMRHELYRRLGSSGVSGWVVRSAGTNAQVGRPMHDLARQVLEENGIPSGGPTAQQVTVSLVDRADVILTATRAEREWVVKADPVAVRRVFTLRQFARLCAAGSAAESATSDQARRELDLAGLAAAGRARVQPVSAADDGIADPIGKRIDAFRDCAGQTSSCIDDVLNAVLEVSGSPARPDPGAPFAVGSGEA